MILAVALSACGGDPDPSGSSSGSGGPTALDGTSWIVASVAGRTPVPGAVPTLEFKADQVTGTGGCNDFGGRYQIDPATGRFATIEVASTLIGCVQPGIGEYESALLGALGAATRAGIDATGQLILDGPGGRIVLARFQPPAVGG